MPLYRVFSQDVGKTGYSGVRDVTAQSAAAAVEQVPPAWSGERMIALPHDRRDLWPHATTGAVPAEAHELQADR